MAGTYRPADSAAAAAYSQLEFDALSVHRLKPHCSRTIAMPSRQSFAYVIVTVLIAITAALLHPLFDIDPQGAQSAARDGGSGAAGLGR